MGWFSSDKSDNIECFNEEQLRERVEKELTGNSFWDRDIIARLRRIDSKYDDKPLDYFDEDELKDMLREEIKLFDEEELREILKALHTYVI